MKTIRKLFIPGAALCGLTAGILLHAAAPADARPQTCYAAAQACERRCSKAYSDYMPCIHRTCDRQYNNCVASGGEKGGPTGGPKGGPKGHLVVTPLQPKHQPGPVMSTPAGKPMGGIVRR